MGLRRLLDTNIVLYHLGGRISPALVPAEYMVSVITELELLSYPGLDQDSEGHIRSFLQEVAVAQLSPEVCMATINLRRKHRLKLPDAIIAATAKVLNAELVTNDENLLKLSELPSASLTIIS